MIIRKKNLEDTHPKHGEFAVFSTGEDKETVRYCDSCGSYLLYREGEKHCIRCEKPWKDRS